MLAQAVSFFKPVHVIKNDADIQQCNAEFLRASLYYLYLNMHISVWPSKITINWFRYNSAGQVCPGTETIDLSYIKTLKKP